MDKYLSAGFSELVQLERLHWIKQIGFHAIRTGANVNPEIADKQMRQLRRAGLGAMLLFKPNEHEPKYVQHIIEMATDLKRFLFSIELGNEENMGAKDRGEQDGARYVDWVNACWLPGKHQTYAGSIHQLIPEAIEWASNVIPKLPAPIFMALHPYRTHTPAGGAGLELFDEWRKIAPERPFGITEMGWHTAWRKRKFPLCWWKHRWTDQQVATFAAVEANHWKKLKATCFTWYQHRDGPNAENDSEAAFGITTAENRPKLVAGVWSRV